MVTIIVTEYVAEVNENLDCRYRSQIVDYNQ